MKSILLTLAAVSLLSATAFAEQTSSTGNGIRLYPSSVSGIVHVKQIECFAAPCPQIVTLESAGHSTQIPWGSKIADDVAAFDGKTVTVLGTLANHPQLGAPGHMDLDAKAFMPGKSADFLTGTLHTRCMNGAASCRAFIEADGKQFMINGDFRKYAGLDGATVTIPGELHSNCPANARCIIDVSEFYPRGENLMVKGNLGMLMTVHNPMVPQAGNYLLKVDGGNTVVVDAGSHNWMDRDGSTVWLSGHMNAGGGDLAPYFTASKASKSVYDNSSPVYAGNDSGNNSDRNANTNPSSSASASSGTGAGIHR